ncbi:MAG TPA: hypothetical protein VLA93_08230, partial [Pyrinomonadaceae bacterium]|nr:hypothetical protein [Pyrinomonadaceae bacterium]
SPRRYGVKERWIMRSVSNLCASSVVSSYRRFDSYRAFRSTAESSGTLGLRRDLKLTHCSFIGVLTVILFAVGIVDAQRPGERPLRDIVSELSRIDTNRAVDLQKIKPNGPNAVRLAIQKQISDDFRDLQALNNQMMATAWSQPEVDYKYIARMVGEIGKKATRLKSNLGLPKSEEKKEEPLKPSEGISNTQELKAELLLLDKSVMSFVNNPIFKKTSVIELGQANQATRDLDAVIERSSTLKKVKKQGD